MQLTIRILGAEVFHLDTDAPSPAPDGSGEVTTYPLGFTPPHVAPHEMQTPDRDWWAVSTSQHTTTAVDNLAAETVAERCEAACRQRMAELARTETTWKTRQHRVDLAIEVDVLLEQYNLLTLGR